jgi:hypothetical protein
MGLNDINFGAIILDKHSKKEFNVKTEIFIIVIMVMFINY